MSTITCAWQVRFKARKKTTGDKKPVIGLKGFIAFFLVKRRQTHLPVNTVKTLSKASYAGELQVYAMVGPRRVAMGVTSIDPPALPPHFQTQA